MTQTFTQLVKNILIFCGVLVSCGLASLAPTSISTVTQAATLESLPMSSYVSFGGRVWQKARFFNGRAEDTTAQTYLIMTTDYGNGVFDNRANYCFPNTGQPGQAIGYNSLANSKLTTLLNTNFYNSLSNNSWIIDKSWTITDDTNNDYRAISVANSNNTSSCVNLSSNINYITVAPVSYTAKVAVPSYLEFNGNPSNLSVFCANSSQCWLRTPYSNHSSGIYVHTITSGGALTSANASTTIGVHPSLHLQNGLITQSGDGSLASPYVLVEGPPTLGSLPMGAVIQVTPNASGMCSDNNCSSLTGTTLPYKLIKMNAANSGDAYFMLADNYCWWGSADCKNSDGSKSAYGAAWNANSSSDNSNILSTPKAYNVTTQLTNFYNSLPADVGGIAKATAIPTKAYDMYPIVWASGAVATTQTACTLTTAGDFNSTNCSWNTKVSLPSYSEWQGGLFGFGKYPTSGQAAYQYCMSRFGVNCSNAGLYGLFNNKGTNAIPRSYYPWLRSPYSGNSTTMWAIDSNSSIYSVGNYSAATNFGVSPSLHLLSTISTVGTGTGTYSDPYLLDLPNSVPTISTLTSPTTDQIITDTLTITGTVSDPDNNDQTLSYQIDSTTGTWTDLSPSVTGLTGGNPAPFTYSVPASSFTAGSHTLNIRSYDGVSYSPVISQTFISNPPPPTLGSLPMGTVIQITPNASGMCSDYNCTSLTNTTLPYKLIKMNAANSGDAYFMLADNYCWWGSADCRDYNGTKIVYGSAWNANYGTDYSNILSTLKTYNITTQLNNFYNSLPLNIGGVTKATAIPTKAYDMYPIVNTSGTDTTTQTACTLSTNGAFNASDCTWNTQVTLPSYTEWQGGLYAYGKYPTSGQAGEEYCKARFGVSCSNAGSYGLFDSTGSNTNPSPRYPWFRSPSSGSSLESWHIYSYISTFSVGADRANNYFGVSPSFNITSSIPTVGGAGTYANPYLLDLPNSAPLISTLTSPLNNSYHSTNTGYDNLTITGTVSDPDNNDQTLSYQIDSTTGAWTDLSPQVTGLTGGNAAFSFSIPVGSLSAGSHTLNLRSSDGTLFSPVITRTFNLDLTPPTLNLTNTSSTWVNNSLTTTITSADNVGGAGLAEIRYSFDTNDLNATCTSGGITVSTGTALNIPIGSHLLYTCARDNVGNVTTQTGEFKWENILPVVSGTNSSADWQYTPITAVLSVSDASPSSSITSSYYAIVNNGDASPLINCAATDIGSVAFTDNTSLNLPTGDKTLYLCAKDTAGNIGTWNGSYRWQLPAPTITATGDNATTNSNIWSNTQISALITAVSEDSTIAQSRYDFVTDDINPLSIDCTAGGNILPTNPSLIAAPVGHNTLFLCTRDNNNTVATWSGIYQWTNNVPTLSATSSNPSAWSNTALNAVVSAQSIAGIANIQYSFDTTIPSDFATACTSGAATSNGATLNPPAGGVNLHLCVKDNANQITTWSAPYNWENTAPDITHTLTGGNYISNIDTWNSSPTITLTASDLGGSGVRGYRYAWDTAFTNTDLTPSFLAGNSINLSIPSNGTHILYYQSQDNALNLSTVKSLTLILDTQEPTIELSVTNPGVTGNNSWFTAAPTLKALVHDNTPTQSGVAGIYQDFKAGVYDNAFTPTSYTDLSIIPNDADKYISFSPPTGLNTNYYFARDKATNQSATFNNTYKVDLENPSASLTYTNGISYQPTLNLTLTNSDPTSGVSTCQLFVATAPDNGLGSPGTFSSYLPLTNTCALAQTFSMTTGQHYKFTYLVTDLSGRSTLITSPNVVTHISPSIEVAATGSSSTIWQNTAPTPTILANASGSLITNLKYSWNTDFTNQNCDNSSGGVDVTSGTTLNNTPLGDNTLYLCVKDDAGHIATWSGKYLWENINPTISATGANTGLWSNSTPSAIISLSDTGGSLIKQALAVFVPAGTPSPLNSFCTAGGNPITNGASLTVPEGNHDLYLCASDNAGNTNTWSGNYKWSANYLTISATDTNASNWTNTPLTTTINYNNSGLVPTDQIRYVFVSHGSPNPLATNCTTGGITLSNTGQSLTVPVGYSDLYLCISDQAGHVTTASGEFKWENFAPTFSSNNGNSGIWLNPDLTTQITLTEPTPSSGLSAASFTWDNASLGANCELGIPLTLGTTNLAVPEGSSTLYLCAKDNANNTTSTNYAYQVNYKIDISSQQTLGNVSPTGTIYQTPGSSLTLTLTPDPGKELISLTIDGINIDLLNDPNYDPALMTYTIDSINSSFTVTALFTAPDLPPSPTPTPTPPPTDNNGGENNSGGNSENNGSAGVDGCAAPTVGTKAPKITHASRVNSTTINLYFTEGERPFTHYLLSYGYHDQEKTFGTIIQNPTTGVFLVGDLLPGYTYDFQLIPFNDCSAGNRSNNFPVKNGKSIPSKYSANLSSNTNNSSSTGKYDDLKKPSTDSNNNNSNSNTEQEIFEIEKVNPTPTPSPVLGTNNPPKKGFFAKVVDTVKSWFSGK